MACTGRKRSWCEKVVHDARNAVLEVPSQTDNDARTERPYGRYPALGMSRRPSPPQAIAALATIAEPSPARRHMANVAPNADYECEALGYP
jgi:hypothetical protein